MQRLLEQLGDRRFFDHLGAVHHDDPLRGLRDHAHVVGDQQDRHPELCLQLVQELEDLRLDRDVERGRSARRR